MSEVIPFFNRLPEPVIPLACRLWDKARSAGYNSQTAYQDFAEDIRHLGIEPPSRAITKRWIAGVQAGLIDRPAGKTIVPAIERTPGDTVRAEVIAKAASRQAGVLLAKIPELSPSRSVPSREADTGDMPAPMDLEALADRLYARTLEELQRGAPASAARLVASRLREIAERIEGGVA